MNKLDHCLKSLESTDMELIIVIEITEKLGLEGSTMDYHLTVIM